MPESWRARDPAAVRAARAVGRIVFRAAAHGVGVGWGDAFLRRVVVPAGRAIPAGVLAEVVAPLAVRRAAAEVAVEWARHGTLARLWAPGPPAGRAAVAGRVWYHTAELMARWADLAGRPDWAASARFEADPWTWAAMTGRTRPVVLIGLHHGPLVRLFCTLRGRGVPVAGLAAPVFHRAVRGAVEQALARADRATGLAGVPRWVPIDKLDDAADFLRGNRTLLVLATGGTGRAVEGEADGVRLVLRPGAIRLAAAVGGIAAGVSCAAGPRGRIRVRIGPPIDGRQSSRRGADEAMADLVRFWAPAVRSSPGQGTEILLDRLRPPLGPAG